MSEKFDTDAAYKEYRWKEYTEKSKNWGICRIAINFAWEWFQDTIIAAFYPNYKRMTPMLAAKVLSAPSMAETDARMKVKIFTSLFFAIFLLVPGLLLLTTCNLTGSYLMLTVGLLSIGFAFAIHCLFNSYIIWISHQYFQAASRFTEEIYLPWLKQEHTEYYKSMMERAKQLQQEFQNIQEQGEKQ